MALVVMDGPAPEITRDLEKFEKKDADRRKRLEGVETDIPVSREVIEKMPSGTRTFAERSLFEVVQDAFRVAPNGKTES